MCQTGKRRKMVSKWKLHYPHMLHNHSKSITIVTTTTDYLQNNAFLLKDLLLNGTSNGEIRSSDHLIPRQEMHSPSLV